MFTSYDDKASRPFKPARYIKIPYFQIIDIEVKQLMTLPNCAITFES